MLLSVENLRKSFRNVEAIRDLSFSIEPGDVFAFLGPNGAGKTTTIRILLDIIRADHGEIAWSFSGKKSLTPPPHLTGYLPEERGLYTDVPIIRSLVYLASIRGMEHSSARQAAMNWLERMELADRANEKLQVLSKGNQQKVQFIASIIHKPDFAILDEPFSGLDPLNQEKFIETIRELNAAGTTVLLSSHQMGLVEKIAKKILLIHKGKAIYQGTIAGIYDNAGISQQLDISFSSALNESSLRMLKEAGEITSSTDRSVLLSLKPDMTMNKALELISSLEGIASIRSQNSSLHELFLSMVKQEQS